MEYISTGLKRDLALSGYTTHFLGLDPKLVLHGRGNASVKTVLHKPDDRAVEGICVKVSLGTIEPAGLPAVRMPKLNALERFETMSDIDMVTRRAEPALRIYARQSAQTRSCGKR